LKILFLIDTLVSGGKERRLTELMKALKGHHQIEFELMTMSNDIHYKEILDLGVPLHYMLRKTKKDISVFYKFYRLCKKSKPDIVHCWDSMTAVYSAPVCKLLKIIFINGMVVDAPAKQNIFNKPWLRGKLTFPLSTAVVGNSFAGISAYKVPNKKSVVIYNGFNFNRVENLINSDQIRKKLNINTRFVVGMVASYSGYKDYKTFYAASMILLESRNDITFLAIGNRTDSIESINLINSKYLPSFRLLGEKSDIESYINTMDLCVLSTFTEGISNSILEYMAMEKPVIATDGGGTNEIIVDQETGFLINATRPEELAIKMGILLDDEKMRFQMGKAGKDRITNKFSITQMINEYIDLYQSVLSK